MIKGHSRGFLASAALLAALGAAGAGAAPKPAEVKDKSKPLAKSKQADNFPRPTQGGRPVKHPNWPRWRQ